MTKKQKENKKKQFRSKEEKLRWLIFEMREIASELKNEEELDDPFESADWLNEQRRMDMVEAILAS